MKYAFMSFSCPDLNLTQLLETANRFGYAGIEPRLGSGHKHGIEIDATREVLAAARQKAQDSGVAICALATSCVFADPAQAANHVAVARRTIETAAEVGAPVIRVFGGQIPSGVSREESMASVIASLRQLADEAAQHQVTVCMETHDHWCDPAHVAAVMRAVDHPAIAVNWDIMHPVLTAQVTMDAAFDQLKDWIRHVHVHDGLYEDKKLVFRPIGAGAVDHRKALQLLQKAGYQGFISGEWIGWEPYEVHLPREIAALRHFETSPAQG